MKLYPFHLRVLKLTMCNSHWETEPPTLPKPLPREVSPSMSHYNLHRQRPSQTQSNKFPHPELLDLRLPPRSLRKKPARPCELLPPQKQCYLS